MSPNAPKPMRPTQIRVRLSTPNTAAIAHTTATVPISRASLSYVPKRRIASSLPDSGTLSMTTPPTAINGEDRASTAAATISPAPSAAAAAATPAAPAYQRGEAVLVVVTFLSLRLLPSAAKIGCGSVIDR